MADREKVIKGLECCTCYCDEETGCPYFGTGDDCDEKLRADAITLLKAQDKDAEIIRKCRDGKVLKHVGNGVVVLNFEWWRKMVEKCDHIKAVPSVEDLLKAQEPRVMTWQEVIGAAIECKPLYIEVKDSEEKEPGDDRWAMVTQYKDDITNGMIRAMSSYITSEILFEDWYGKSWRCWTSRPTNAQREAEPWMT